MTALQLLAGEVGASDRTLRRAINEGALRATRPTPRTLELPLSERQFVRRSWPLLSTLRNVLRTESNVRFAMLFGSTARGQDRATSDLDLLVDMGDSDFERVVDLSEKLSEATGRSVDLVRLDDAESDPALLADWIAEGRVVVDREQRWRRLRRRRPTLARKARGREQERTEAALGEIATMLARAG